MELVIPWTSILDDNVLRRRIPSEVGAFPLLDAFVFALQQIVFLALRRDLEHFPVSDNVLHFVLEVSIENGASRTVARLARVCEVDTVRSDIRPISRDVVVIGHR